MCAVEKVLIIQKMNVNTRADGYIIPVDGAPVAQ